MTIGQHFPGPDPVRLAGAGLVLREWLPADLPHMVELFDEQEIRRWTPLAAPFDLPAAQAYLDRSIARREEGSALQLAVTSDDGGGLPMGEVLLFMHPGVAEIGWALGAVHRGRRVASRAVRMLISWAAGAWQIERFRALIEPGNVASERVARTCGFVPVPGVPVLVESRGRPVELTAWQLSRRAGKPVAVAGEAPRSG